MSEMLGNQYFLARKYAQATAEYERTLAACPGNKVVRRKLIVCYTQIGRIEKALAIFKSLVMEDIAFIIDTAENDEDCPCPEIIHDMEARLAENESSLDYHLILGMLWLYCDVANAQKYFKIARQFEDKQDMIDLILNRIAMKLKAEKMADSKRHTVSSNNSRQFH